MLVVCFPEANPTKVHKNVRENTQFGAKTTKKPCEGCLRSTTWCFWDEKVRNNPHDLRFWCFGAFWPSELAEFAANVVAHGDAYVNKCPAW